MSTEETRIITERLDRIERITLISAKSVLDLEETAILTGFTTGHLYRLTSNRKIPHYKKNRKLYFHKKEVEEWMLEQKIASESEIQSKAETYISTHNSNARSCKRALY